MSRIHAGFYRRTYPDGTPSVLFFISERGQEWRWSPRDHEWVALEGMTVVERVMDGDPWTDEASLPAGVPEPPS